MNEKLETTLVVVVVVGVVGVVVWNVTNMYSSASTGAHRYLLMPSGGQFTRKYHTAVLSYISISI